MKRKNTKRPDLATKYKALVFYERELPDTESQEKRVQAVSKHIGRPLSRQLFSYWLKEKEDIYAQVNEMGGAGKRRSVFKRQKIVINNEQKSFEREVSVELMSLFQNQNLTLSNAMSVAKRIKEEKYPNFENFHRKPCSGYGRRYVRGLMRRQGWHWKRCLGSMKPVPIETLRQADIEFSKLLDEYEENQVGNVDESSMLLSFCGLYSWQRNQKTRKLNKLDSKKRVTWMRVILRDGKSDFKTLILDKAVPRELKTTLISKSPQIPPNLSVKEMKKAEKSKWAIYKIQGNSLLATNQNAFMTRSLFRKFLSMYDLYLQSQSTKKILIMDRLRAHVLDWSHYTRWRKESQSVVYVDSFSFRSLTLAYLPASCTGLAQPADLTYNSCIQQAFKCWFNSNGNKFEMKRGEKLIQIGEIVESVNTKIIKNAWSLSELQSLYPKQHEIDVQIRKESLASHQEWSLALRRKYLSFKELLLTFQLRDKPIFSFSTKMLIIVFQNFAVLIQTTKIATKKRTQLSYRCKVSSSNNI